MTIQLPRKGCFFLLLLLIAFLSGCSSREYALYRGNGNNKQLVQLFRLLDNASAATGQELEQRYIIISRIISEYRSSGDRDRMNLFLSDYLNSHPQDPYAAYYLMTIAGNYKEEKGRTVAETYYRRILANYPDLVIGGKSVHKAVLEELGYNSENYEERVSSLNELLKRFPGEVDKGQIYYYLGKSYEKLGSWDKAFAAYRDFLNAPETEIAGNPNARQKLTDLLRFQRSSKSWTMEDLDDLVMRIKTAIRQRSGSKLKSYMAEKFFTMSWSQDETDLFTHTKLDISSFLNPSVWYMPGLDEMSNESEAYLRSWGWSYRIPTWYLYFRKIDYPADPEINGRWEWSGIYFGDTF